MVEDQQGRDAVTGSAVMGDAEEVVTKYSVSVLPISHPAWYEFSVDVEWTGNAEDGATRWAVRRHGFCLEVDPVTGAFEFEFEASSSMRDGGYLARTRFCLDTALQLAKRVAPGLSTNGWTAARVLREDPEGHHW